ncbi:glycoside hydrolase family 16 protein [Streptomyces sp. BBFR2]|uniref:glycoside hydrolase family 16 protein n=1 Tax=Streptomyces sp. BBFR2 TaxID=3372854 RepID=UPI0037D9F6E0
MIMKIRMCVAAAACALAAAVPLWSAPPAASAGEAAPAFQEVWRTDFDGAAGSRPSADDWITDTGTGYPGGPDHWGTGEVQTYTDAPENLQLDGAGHLKITALKKDGGWTSGRIETQRTDFAAPEGGALRIEARIQLPQVSGGKALGYWPAFWTLGADFRDTGNWPAVGEFDVMENVNGADTLWGTLHCGVTPGGPCNETDGKGGSHPCTGCRDTFHTYALELDRTDPAHEKLTWFLDGVAYHTVAASEMDADTWARATHHGHFVLLNLAMGGGFPDGVAGHATPTDTTEPGASLLVDNVAISVAAPASAPTP